MNKTKLGLSLIAILFCLGVQGVFTSCTKTNTVIKTVTDTLTKTVTDTVTISDTALTATILTANSWKAIELRGLLGDVTDYYVRGGSNNTVNLDNEYITFNSDGSGIYFGGTGISSPLTWHFTDNTNTTLVWIWEQSTPITVTWENLFYKNGAIHYTENYIENGENELTAGIRVPK